MKIYLLLLLCFGVIIGCNAHDEVELFLSTKDLGVGTNRFAIAIVDEYGFKSEQSINIDFQKPNENIDFSTELIFEEFPDFYATGIKRGIYYGFVDFSSSGEWILEIAGTKYKFEVKDQAISRNIGDIALKSNNLTLNNASIKDLTTGTNPDLRFYDSEISSSLELHKPIIISFMSPAFCTTPTCGPQMEVLSYLADKYDNRIEIIHIETFLNPQEVKNDFNSRELNPVITQWGLNEDQWTYVINSSGIISGKFEGFASISQLSKYLDPITKN